MMSHNTDTSDTDNGSSFVACDSCGKMVAEMSLTVHKLRSCEGAETRHQPRMSTASDESIDMESTPSVEIEHIDSNMDQRQDVIEIDDYDGDENGSYNDDRMSRVRQEHPLATPEARQRRRQRLNSPDVPEVVNLVDSPAADTETPPSGEETEWACPQCTLLNSNTESTCNACRFPSPYRPPDETRREQLLPNVRSPAMFVSGGALLGGVLGAAGSWMNGGGDILSAAAEGAMTGVVGGAVLQDMLGSNIPQRQQQNNNDDISAARSSAAMGMAGYPSLSPQENTSGGRRRARPRASYRTLQQRDEITGLTTFMVQGGGRTSILQRRRSDNNNINDPLLSMLLNSYIAEADGVNARRGGHAMGGHDVANMGYEELLQAFGNGTENLGGDERQIQSLPTHTVQDPQTELPEDARECSICLSEFEKGEKRKILPCLHGFHQNCADKWLRANASCPVCKHRLS
eukprot:scaffold1736_cov127-Cylindrotheca_fusiformis.AAC.103